MGQLAQSGQSSLRLSCGAHFERLAYVYVKHVAISKHHLRHIRLPKVSGGAQLPELQLNNHYACCILTAGIMVNMLSARLLRGTLIG